MGKLLYLVYYLLITVGSFLALRLLWSVASGRKLRWRAFAMFIVISGLISAYYYWETSRRLDVLGEARIDYARQPGPVIGIAVAWPENQDSFVDGARRAVKELNTTSHELNMQDGSKHPYQIELKEFLYTSKNVGEVARKIAQDDTIAGVIGHPQLENALQAAATYNASNLLFLSSGVRSPLLTDYKYPTVFSLTPSDVEIADVVKGFANSYDLFNLVALSPRDDYANDTYQIYRGAMNANGEENRVDAPRLTQFVSYSPNTIFFADVITDLADNKADLVLLLGTSAADARIIEQMRRRGVNTSVICLPEMRDEVLRVMEITPENTSMDVYVISFETDIYAESADAAVTENNILDGRAYEAVKLMVAAWSQIGTVEAGPVALALRALPRWVWGNTTVDFEDNGHIKDVAIRVEKLDLSLPGKSKIVYSGEQ